MKITNNSDTESKILFLNEQQHRCAANNWMHAYESRVLYNRNRYISIMITIFTSCSATMSIVTNIDYLKLNNLNNIYINVINIIFIIILYVSACLNSIQQILNYSKQAELHNNLSIKYLALYNNIKQTLVMYNKSNLNTNTKSKLNKFYFWSNNEYDNIQRITINVSNNTKKKFKTTFKLEMFELDCNEIKHIDNGASIVNNEHPEQEISIGINNEQHEQEISIDINEPVIKENNHGNKNGDINFNKIKLEETRMRYELDRFMSSY